MEKRIFKQGSKQVSENMRISEKISRQCIKIRRKGELGIQVLKLQILCKREICETKKTHKKTNMKLKMKTKSHC